MSRNSSCGLFARIKLNVSSFIRFESYSYYYSHTPIHTIYNSLNSEQINDRFSKLSFDFNSKWTMEELLIFKEVKVEHLFKYKYFKEGQDLPISSIISSVTLALDRSKATSFGQSSTKFWRAAEFSREISFTVGERIEGETRLAQRRKLSFLNALLAITNDPNALSVMLFMSHNVTIMFIYTLN